MGQFIFNLYDLPLLITVGQCLLLVIILFFTRAQQGEGSTFLVLLLGAIGFKALDTLIYWNPNLNAIFRSWGTWPFWVLSWAFIAQGFLLYSYVRTRLIGRFWQWRKHWFHLVPIALIPLWIALVYNDLGADRWLEASSNWQVLESSWIFQVGVWAQRFTVLAYGVLAWRFWRDNQLRLESVVSDPAAAEPVWLKMLVFGFLALCLWTIVMTLATWLNIPGFPGWMGIAYSFFTFFFVNSLVVFSLLKPALREYIPEASAPSAVAPEVQEQLHAAQELRRLLIDKQLYLDPELSISQLATAAELDSRRASELINNYLGQNFFEFVNLARVERAKELLATSDVPVLQVQERSGFKSKATFNRIFKRYAEKTPSEYRMTLSE